MSKILLIEDDKQLGAILNHFLQKENFEVVWVTTLSDARIKLAMVKPNLVLLDWMLPDGQGIDFLKDIRAEKNYIPFIMLTARSELLDKVIGLEAGADDYLTKPFEPRELVARIRVQLRKEEQTDHEQAKEQNQKISRKNILIDLFSREVFFESQLIHLTKMEFDLLVLLADNPGRPYTREELLNKVWGFEFTPTTRTVDTHILQLRQKFGDEIIETVRGVGYRFNKNYK